MPIQLRSPKARFALGERVLHIFQKVMQEVYLLFVLYKCAFSGKNMDIKNILGCRPAYAQVATARQASGRNPDSRLRL